MTSTNRVHRLTAVYNADGGLRGDLAYVYGKLRGTTECALCDITHRGGGLRRNREWDQMVCNLDVPVDVVHLNERSTEVMEASAERTPCVLAHTDAGVVMLLDPKDLKAVGGDANAFAIALEKAVRDAGLRLTAESVDR